MSSLCAHPLLRSFPTRRSSDLLSDCREVAVADDTTMLVPEAEDYVADPSATACPDPDGAGPLTRSEEHTSELQSQSNLVCRLLLENKNLPWIIAVHDAHLFPEG